MPKLDLLFFGDVYIPHGATQPQLSQEVAQIVNSADYVIGNLEAPITDRKTSLNKIGPSMQQGLEALNFLSSVQADVVSLANNHMMDYNAEGLQDTFAALEQKGISCIGAGASDSLFKAYRINRDEITVSILAAAENGFGCCLSEDNAGYAWILDPRFEEAIRREVLHSTYVILFLHAGVEFIDSPLPEWRDLYRRLIDLGCSAIIAHHPHVTQGMEEYKDCPIYYSIGNYYFGVDDSDPRWYQNMMVKLTISAQSKKLVVTEYFGEFSVGGKISLGSQSGSERFNQLSAELKLPEYEKRLHKELAERWVNFYRESFAYPVNGLTGRLGIKAFLKRIWTYLTGGGFNLIQSNMLWHNLVIESHRWAVQRILVKRLF